MCEREIESECVCERDRECVCEREIESVCVCVCEKYRVSVWQATLTLNPYNILASTRILLVLIKR